MTENNKCLIIFLTRMYATEKNNSDDEFDQTFPNNKDREQIIDPPENESFCILTIHGYKNKFLDKFIIDANKTVQVIKKALSDENIKLENYSSIKIGYHNNSDFKSKLESKLNEDQAFKVLKDKVEVKEYTIEGGVNTHHKSDLLRKWTEGSFPLDKQEADSKRKIVNRVIHETVKTFKPFLFDLEQFSSYVKELTEAHSERKFTEQAKEITERASLVFERENLTNLWQESTEKLIEIAGNSQTVLKSFSELDSLLSRLSEELLKEEQKEPEK